MKYFIFIEKCIYRDLRDKENFRDLSVAFNCLQIFNYV